MFFELASGGAHLVKDDEILPDLSLCPAEARLKRAWKPRSAPNANGARDTLRFEPHRPGEQNRRQSQKTRQRRSPVLSLQCLKLRLWTFGGVEGRRRADHGPSRLGRSVWGFAGYGDQLLPSSRITHAAGWR